MEKVKIFCSVLAVILACCASQALLSWNVNVALRGGLAAFVASFIVAVVAAVNNIKYYIDEESDLLKVVFFVAIAIAAIALATSLVGGVVELLIWLDLAYGDMAICIALACLCWVLMLLCMLFNLWHVAIIFLFAGVGFLFIGMHFDPSTV